MELVSRSVDVTLSTRTKRLLHRMFGQLCGLDQQITFLLRSRYGPRFLVSGAELTGVHVLQRQPRPRGVAPYHIGGCGVLPDEALIRCLGETVERYTQLTSEIGRRGEVRFASHTELVKAGERVVDADALRMFAPEQHEIDGFPFQAFDEDAPMGWLAAQSLLDGDAVWVPAQHVLVGYAARREAGEPRVVAGVTTGGAAHTSPVEALRNGLRELIQIDAAIGHWFSSSPSHRIVLDDRVATFSAMLKEYLHPAGPQVSFYWIPNPDLPGFTIACLIGERDGGFPAVAVGLGASAVLSRALYKALLEAVGSFGLGVLTVLDRISDNDADTWVPLSLDPERFFDLDSNVAYWALPENAPEVYRRFDSGPALAASDLPRDCPDPVREMDELLEACKQTDKQLVALDLTTPDARQLGFTSIRTWSPDTVPLALPSAPPLRHPRFKAFGGVSYRRPHPYA